MTRYVAKPDWFTVRVFNAFIAALIRMGMTAKGGRVLSVRGRKTGQWRRTPVQVLTVDGADYLVAPRGHVQWTRNLRASGEGELRGGKRVEKFTATEVPDAEKPPLLRAYLGSHGQARLFRVAGADVPEEELVRIAPDHPVFRVSITG